MTTKAPNPPLPHLLVTHAVTHALEEDLGRRGDVTTDSIVPAEANASGVIAARQSGTIAGLQLAKAAFHCLNPEIQFEAAINDGDVVKAGGVIAEISGQARTLLTAERVALNYLGHLSGIATLTRSFVDTIAGTSSQICCTRKTTPGQRVFEKYAVRAGGGANHRFGLDDALLIKDNHIAIAGGIGRAIERACTHAGHMLKIEVEVDTLDQLKEALHYPIDAVLLDNMSVEDLNAAVRMVEGRVLTEASGGVTLETVRAIAETHVDLISIGYLTHSAPALDLGLDFN